VRVQVDQKLLQTEYFQNFFFLTQIFSELEHRIFLELVKINVIHMKDTFRVKRHQINFVHN
jgi:hypothetical protein